MFQQFRTCGTVVWIIETLLFHVAVFTSAYHHPRFSILPCCGRNLNFNSADVKISCNMNFKTWSNCGSSWNGCVDPGIWIFARKCVFSAGRSSVFKTIIIYVKNGFVAHSRKRHYSRMLHLHKTPVYQMSFSSVPNL